VFGRASASPSPARRRPHHGDNYRREGSVIDYGRGGPTARTDPGPGVCARASRGMHVPTGVATFVAARAMTKVQGARVALQRQPLLRPGRNRVIAAAPGGLPASMCGQPRAHAPVDPGATAQPDDRIPRSTRTRVSKTDASF